MGSTQCERGHSGINAVNACLNSLDDAHGSKAGSIVGVKLDRNLNGSLQILYKACSLIRSQQSRHILDADRIRAGILDLLSVVHVILMGEYLAEGVGNSYLCVTLLLLGCLDGGLEVADIVQCVEDTDNVDTICDGLLNEVLYQVVSIVTVTQHVLTSEQHLKLGVRHFLSQDTESLPRILVQEAYAGIEGRAAPALSGVEADLVHLGEDRTHFVHRHSCGKQGLVRVTKNGFSYL